jgi:hypothetical protein
MRWPALLIVLTACGNADGPTERLPGPCSASRPSVNGNPATECTMTYDDAGRQLSADCVSLYGPESEYTSHFDHVYSEDRLVRASAGNYEFGNSAGSTFEFGPDAVTEEDRTFFYDSLISYDSLSTYEPDLVILGHPFDPENRLRAPDALLSYYETRHDGDADPPIDTVVADVTYTFDGPPRTGTRTRTGSDGSSATFTYDAAGHLLTGFEWDGDVLVRDVARDTTYEHDEHGNLLAKTGPTPWADVATMTFDYGCW